ncbi:hypothetical protein EMIT0P176_470019 [Pseudomonas sp. IT-P176]
MLARPDMQPGVLWGAVVQLSGDPEVRQNASNLNHLGARIEHAYGGRSLGLWAIVR